MIKQENFMQIQQVATARYLKVTEHRYKTNEEKVIAENSYIQGRVDSVSDMESLVAQHNRLVDERDKLKKELAQLKAFSNAGLGL